MRAGDIEDDGRPRKDSAAEFFLGAESFVPCPSSWGARLAAGRSPKETKNRMTDVTVEPQTLDQLMAALRPRLHRYCARMVGSAVDGEDVVQEALAKAAAALPGAGAIDRPESWLFRIAHNTALDALRRRKRQPATRSDLGLAG